MHFVPKIKRGFKTNLILNFTKTILSSSHDEFPIPLLFVSDKFPADKLSTLPSTVQDLHYLVLFSTFICAPGLFSLVWINILLGLLSTIYISSINTIISTSPKICYNSFQISLSFPHHSLFISLSKCCFSVFPSSILLLLNGFPARFIPFCFP